VSHARVEEVRGEGFVADVWTVNPALTVESGFTYEASTITQSGDQSKERQFSYPKPRITATWAVDAADQVRASLQRDVSQLDFAEFSSTVDFVNAASTQGNPNLKPQQAWKARVEWQRRFGKRGALTLAAFHDEVQDVHDLVDIGGSDAYGNIGDGTRSGMEIKAAVPLAFLGLPTAELRINGLYQQTQVTDPKTGLTRSFSVSPERQGSPSGSPALNAGDKDWAYVINFRQELPGMKAAWGSALVQWSGRREYKRVEMIDYRRATPRLDVYWETTALKPVTIRFNVNNIFSPSEARVRTFYQGDRGSGIVSRTESREAKGGPEGTRSAGVQVSGKF
jgi:outer membrane receptor protein involved in Fe transport